jgi:predicted ATP-dependent serine protease
MALTCCLKCDKCYGENKPRCPHCGAYNFFADNDTLGPAVDVLVEKVKLDAKLAELAAVRAEILDPLPFAEEI